MVGSSEQRCKNEKILYVELMLKGFKGSMSLEDKGPRRLQLASAGEKLKVMFGWKMAGLPQVHEAGDFRIDCQTLAFISTAKKPTGKQKIRAQTSGGIA